MSIEYQAAFWLRNVANTDLKIIKQRCHLDDNIIDGLSEFRDFLKNIYADHHSFEVSKAEPMQTKIGIMSNDLENYHNLTETLDCLYAIAKVGVLHNDGAASYLQIQKEDFKNVFKKSTVFPFEIFQKHSFYFAFYKNEKEVLAYKSCNTFCLFYEGNNFLLSALKHFVGKITPKVVKEDYCGSEVLFYTADYASVLLGESTKRKEIEPKRLGIYNTLGECGELWQYINNELTINYDISLNPYVFPNWNFKFLNKNKTVCTFGIGVDRLSIRLPLTYSLAKELILKMVNLPDNICNCIKNFGCINCGKCQNQSNIQMVNGIGLCTLNYSNFVTEDSRIIATEIKSKDDLEVIVGLIKKLLE